MNLIKLLIIAIFGIVVEGAECAAAAPPLPPPAVNPVLDLPDDTLGLRIGNTQNKVVNNIADQECLHIIVPGTEAEDAYNDKSLSPLNAKERADYAASKIGNIYFPKNGVQPTTPEAVEYSCANVGANDLDHPITDWYVQMFGGPDHNGHNPNLRAGFITLTGTQLKALTPRPTASSIITMDARSMAGRKTADFWQDFRKIASTRTGRILLYRILIEIRRQRNIDGSWKAYISDEIVGVTSALNLQARANCRNLTIKWSNNGNSFTRSTHTICYANTNRKMTTICEKIGNNHPICMAQRDSDIGLFHEMVHWFHVLRHPERHSKERVAFKTGQAVSLRDISRYETIGGYFWNGIDDNNTNSWKISAIPWVGRSDNESYVNFEEIRTILGAPTFEQYRVVVQNDPLHPNPYVFLNGDDLSENKYRVSVNAKLRFGHSNQPFYEDDAVIQKVIDVSGAGNNNLINLVDYNTLDDENKPECKIGLGNFLVGGYNINGMIP